MHPIPVRDFKKGGSDLGKDALPSRQDAFLTGVMMTLLQQCPAIYAYLRDGEVDEKGDCFLIFYKLPPEVVVNLTQVINVQDQKAYEFQQHGVFFTAIKFTPSDDEMEELSGYYHDKSEEDGAQKEEPKDKPEEEDLENP